MKAFLDTSVLIATFYADHQFHQPSIDLFLRFKKSESSCGAHSLAEIYSSLTGRTGPGRVSGEEASALETTAFVVCERSDAGVAKCKVKYLPVATR